MSLSPITFHAALSNNLGEQSVADVRCKLMLPRQYSGPIRLKFYPSAEQQEIIQQMPEFAVVGEVKDSSERVITRLRAKRVFWKYDEHESVSWSSDSSEWVMLGEPIGLLITDSLHDAESEADDRVVGSFWLTRSSLLSHARLDEPLEEGGFRVKTIHQPRFRLPDNSPVVFKQEYDTYKNEQGEQVSFSQPVLEFEIDKQRADNLDDDDLHSLISDFLVLISFAARQRCTCVGWDVKRGSSYQRYYRRDISIPAIERKPGWPNGLIELIDVEEFMTVAQSSFDRIEHKESVRRALNHAIPTTGETLESEFVGLYAALESMLSFFRANEDFEILSAEDFVKVGSDLKKWLKEHPLLKDKNEKRKLLYEKIRELNRVSFSAVFRRFCSQYSVDLNDLWPVMGKSEDWPLSEIRNKLVHGATFSYRQDGVLHCATENLKWTVDRMLLAILKWPVEKTRVRPDYLARVMTMHQQWPTKREALQKQ